MSQILLQLLNGLVVGSSLALVAAGLALLFGVLHIINFAQGDFFMMGGYAVCFALKYTRWGIRQPAVAHNRPMAPALAVPVPRVYIVPFLASSALAAMAGGLLLPLQSVSPTVGGDVIQDAFIIVVAGGLGNF